jgi:hypothetical protein
LSWYQYEIAAAAPNLVPQQLRCELSVQGAIPLALDAVMLGIG